MTPTRAPLDWSGRKPRCIALSWSFVNLSISSWEVPYRDISRPSATRLAVIIMRTTGITSMYAKDFVLKVITIIFEDSVGDKFYFCYISHRIPIPVHNQATVLVRWKDKKPLKIEIHCKSVGRNDSRLEQGLSDSPTAQPIFFYSANFTSNFMKLLNYDCLLGIRRSHPCRVSWRLWNSEIRDKPAERDEQKHVEGGKYNLGCS